MELKPLPLPVGFFERTLHREGQEGATIEVNGVKAITFAGYHASTCQSVIVIPRYDAESSKTAHYKICLLSLDAASQRGMTVTN